MHSHQSCNDYKFLSSACALPQHDGDLGSKAVVTLRDDTCLGEAKAINEARDLWKTRYEITTAGAGDGFTRMDERELIVRRMMGLVKYRGL